MVTITVTVTDNLLRSPFPWIHTHQIQHRQGLPETVSGASISVQGSNYCWAIWIHPRLPCSCIGGDLTRARTQTQTRTPFSTNRPRSRHLYSSTHFTSVTGNHNHYIHTVTYIHTYILRSYIRTSYEHMDSFYPAYWRQADCCGGSEKCVFQGKRIYIIYIIYYINII